MSNVIHRKRFPWALDGRGRRAIAISVVAVVVILMAVFAPQWTVKSLDDVNATSAVAGSENLDPAKYVAAIWETKLLPTVAKSAVEMSALLQQLRDDRRKTVARYGNVASLGGAPAFLVKGSGRVVSIDTDSLISTAGIAFGDGVKPDIRMQIGPILSGTDVRDALKFINFNQFLNQVQYEEVSVEINSRIRHDVLADVDPAKLKGQNVEFTGAFSYSDPRNITVMPVTLDVGGR